MVVISPGGKDFSRGGDKRAAVSLSVIIPTYNRAGVVARAVQSVLAQESISLEVIVVDDGSQEDTESVIASIRDERIIFLRIDHAGVSTARNAGARIARGRWLAFLDSDDEVAPGWAAAMVGHLQAGATIVICGGEARDPEGHQQWVWLPRAVEGDPPQSVAEKFLAGMFMLERTAFWEVGGYESSLAFGENTELALRLIFSDFRPVLAVESQALLRIHSGPPHDAYQTARVGSARYVLENHPWLSKRLPALCASYHAIVGVDAARKHEWSAARRHFFRAVIAKPGLRHLGRLGLSMVPPLGAHYWRLRHLS